MHFLNTLEKKLYQIIISRLNGDHIHSSTYQEKVFELVRKGVGGFILFGGEREEVKAFIEKIQSLSKIPLFIASDVERGVGQQIAGCTVFPCQMAVRAAIHKDRPEEVTTLRDAIKAIAHEAIDVGINMPLIPVLDVNRDPDNPIICTRAFSDDPGDVSWFGSEYITVLEDSGLMSCAKHFPGHGDTSIDSHLSLPRITRPFQDLMSIDIFPFIEAIKAGVSSIMVGHLHIAAIDSMPASLSGKVIRELLRKDLGFKGIVLTDALSMSALSGIDHVPARCIDAGVDLLLHSADADLTVKELEYAIRSKVIVEEYINAAIERILKMKAKIGYIKRKEVDYNNHRSLSERITDMSMTLVKHRGGILPVTDSDRVHLIISGENRFYEPTLWGEHFCHAAPALVSGVSASHEILNQILKQVQDRVQNDTFRVQDDTSMVHSDIITIIALFSEVAAWKGNSGIHEEVKRQIIELIRKAKCSIVISFGSPYVLRHFTEADILIAAYEAGEQAQRAVLKCLKGEIGFRGQMPVDIHETRHHPL